MQAIDLLTLLNAMVQADGGVSGLKGHVAIGVRSPDGDRWWQADLRHAPVRVAFTDERPSEVDAHLFMGELEARSIVAHGTLPATPSLLEAGGDRRLLRAFVTRYTRRDNVLSLRARR